MDTKTILYWIAAAALLWILLSWLSSRSDMYRRQMNGGMDPGVFDQMASNSGPEDAYLMYPDTYAYSYDY
jgi:hypothetical protein